MLVSKASYLDERISKEKKNMLQLLCYVCDTTLKDPILVEIVSDNRCKSNKAQDSEDSSANFFMVQVTENGWLQLL